MGGDDYDRSGRPARHMGDFSDEEYFPHFDSSRTPRSTNAPRITSASSQRPGIRASITQALTRRPGPDRSERTMGSWRTQDRQIVPAPERQIIRAASPPRRLGICPTEEEYNRVLRPDFYMSRSLRPCEPIPDYYALLEVSRRADQAIIRPAADRRLQETNPINVRNRARQQGRTLARREEEEIEKVAIDVRDAARVLQDEEVDRWIYNADLTTQETRANNRRYEAEEKGEVADYPRLI